ncbi:Tn7 transposase TnsA N-terminal domain-containing protein [Glaesserella parasuis]|uniref:Tn7 transposase TnsA N-terminal domain-containing protein n=1 Tax=Glaesserella parasuis TaxID=738 RepID=UPI003CF6E6C2
MEQVRKIKPTRLSISGRILCKGKSIPYESTLERDFLIIQDFHPDIKSVTAQPISIKFQKNGREYLYTPDFYVEYHDFANRKDMIVEVKPEDLWRENWREWSDKWKAMQRYCQKEGLVFHIYDENRIRTVALDNINLIKGFKNTAIEEADIKAVLEQVELMGITTIDYLLTRFYTGKLLRNQSNQ